MESGALIQLQKGRLTISVWEVQQLKSVKSQIMSLEMHSDPLPGPAGTGVCDQLLLITLLKLHPARLGKDPVVCQSSMQMRASNPTRNAQGVNVTIFHRP